jgi:hypothetical protein
MADEKNPFEAIQALMLENLEKMQGVSQSYSDMFEKAMQGLPGANQERHHNRPWSRDRRRVKESMGH